MTIPNHDAQMHQFFSSLEKRETVDEFIARGGTIQVLQQGESSGFDKRAAKSYGRIRVSAAFDSYD